MGGRIQKRLAVVAVLSTLIALFGGTLGAQADPQKELQVSVSPATTTASTPTDFMVTITNLSSPQLGGVEITVPFAVNSAPTDIEASAGKAWSGIATGQTVRLTADTQSDRLLSSPQEAVTFTINATPPNNTDRDEIYSWTAAGRQANTFNDAMGGNEVVQKLVNRTGTFDRRNADGSTTAVLLGTHQTLVTGTAVDCSVSCSASLAQYQTTVTVSADCGDGILVVDTTILDPTQIGAAAFYNYFGGCDVGTIVTVDFVYPKSLAGSPGSLLFAAVYGDKEEEATEIDPNYVGDGNPLPSCKRNVTVNCVSSISGGPGVVSGQLKMLLTDPGGYGFS